MPVSFMTSDWEVVVGVSIFTEPGGLSLVRICRLGGAGVSVKVQRRLVESS
jgi:hypothetical protein